MKNKFYVTTPIYYVNGRPHIGHAYTTILADVLASFHRAAGEAVFFLTGLDEHGHKVQQAAEKRGMTPLEHCNDLAPRFTDLWKKLEIRNDDFIRTTEPRHTRVVQACLQNLFTKGDIYSSEYEGWYSVAEERFITDTEMQSGQFREIKKIKEKNYFFRMSKYQDALIKHIEDNSRFIQPEHRRNEILGFLRQPLTDLCISRPKERLSWGIEIPFDRDYVTYVWFDALVNYITAPGYLSDEAKFNKWWPADVHLIGKDILTTHCVYWSTMLMALGVPLPRTIFAHGWWLTGDAKMSKSLGNVVDPLSLIETYGVDSVRYYLMREMVLGQDANFTVESFIKRYNSDLANDFGNLLNRVSGLINKHFDGLVPPGADAVGGRYISVVGLVKGNKESQIVPLDEKVEEFVREFRVHEAIDKVMFLVRQTNWFIEKMEPWKVVKTDRVETGRILYTATEALRISAVLLAPVMPQKCLKILEVLGAVGTGTTWGELKPGTKLQAHEALFPRIEIEKSDAKKDIQ